MRGRGVLYRSLVVLVGILALVALPATSSATLAPTPGPYMGWNTYYQVGSEWTFALSGWVRRLVRACR